MIPIHLNVLVQSSVANKGHIKETLFTKGLDLMALPRIGETVLVGNYVLEVVDVMHSQLAPIKIYGVFSMASEDLVTEDQMAVLSQSLRHGGWQVEDSSIRERNDAEVDTRRLN